MTAAGVSSSLTSLVQLAPDQSWLPLPLLFAVLSTGLVGLLFWRGVAHLTRFTPGQRHPQASHRGGRRADGLSLEERVYLEQSVNRKYSVIELRALDEREARTAVTLREVYIPLRGQGRGDGEEDLPRVALAPRHDPPSNLAPDEQPAEPPVIEPPLLTTFVECSPRLIIRGRAGSGKTTFIKFVATALADALLADKPGLLRELSGLRLSPVPFPIYFPLVDFNSFLKERAQHASDLTAQREDEALLMFLIHNFESAGLSRAFFTRRLEEGRCMIFLDGLDEVETNRRQMILDLIGAFVRRFDPGTGRSMNRFIIASRPEASIDLKAPARFDEVELLPLSDDMIHDFIPRWYRAVLAQRADAARSADELSQTLLAAIDQKPQVRELAASPLLLTLVALIHYRQQLPENRKDLYARCTQLLLEDWDKSRPGEAGRRLHEEHSPPGMPSDYAGRAAYLEPAAYWLLRQGRHEARAIEWVREMIFSLQLDDSPSQEDTLREFLEWAVRRGALLEKSTAFEDVYRFAYHRTFQEYLAARYLSDSLHLQEALALAPQREWTETLRLLAAELKPPRQYDFLAAALDRHPVCGPLLVGECLAEIRDASLRERLGGPTQDRLTALMVDLRVPVEDRAAAGRLLAALGDDRPGVGVTTDQRPDIDWRPIPAGEFQMGSDLAQDAQAFDDEQPQQTVALDAFLISRYPVTHAQFRPFVESGGYQTRAWWTSAGWAWKGDRAAPALWDDRRWRLDNHPVVGVSWYEAVAYSRWLTALLRAGDWDPPVTTPQGWTVRLPTEAEWEKAARGTEGRLYPWGCGFDANRCNTAESGIGRTSPVGIFPLPEGPWGDDTPLDMSGNVWEWVSTKWLDRPDSILYGDDDLEGSAARAIRGGSWRSHQGLARCASRYATAPGDRHNGLGFRLVLAPPVAPM